MKATGEWEPDSSKEIFDPDCPSSTWISFSYFSYFTMKGFIYTYNVETAWARDFILSQMPNPLTKKCPIFMLEYCRAFNSLLKNRTDDGDIADTRLLYWFVDFSTFCVILPESSKRTFFAPNKEFLPVDDDDKMIKHSSQKGTDCTGHCTSDQSSSDDNQVIKRIQTVLRTKVASRNSSQRHSC